MTDSEAGRQDNQVVASAQEAPDLQAQASRLRRTGHGPRMEGHLAYSAWQKALVLIFALAVLAAAFFLLISAATRERLISRLGSEYERVYQSEADKGIHRLPAPPPETPRTRTLYESPAIIASRPSGVETMPVEGVEGDEERPQKIYVPPPRTPDSSAAFELLRSQSQAAGQLVAGQLADFEYQDWRPVENKSPEFLIALVAKPSGRSGSTEFIWLVNLESRQVQARSQAARDLEFKYRNRQNK